MDAALEVDYREVDVRAGDCFVSTTDDVHDHLPEAELLETVLRGVGAGSPFEKVCAS